MNLLDFDSFIYDIPWSENVRHKLCVMSDRDDVRYLVAWDNAGRPSCSGFTAKPESWPDTAFAIWSKRGDDPRNAAQPLSKTMQALAMVLDEGLTVYAAAKQVGVHESAVHRAIKRREGRDICPHCNQVIRDQGPAPVGA